MSNDEQLKIHLRLQQRTARKSITIIENLIEKIETMFGEESEKILKKILKHFKKKFACNASVLEDDKIIQLQGDHRQDVVDYLIEKNVATNDDIIIHGF